MTKKIGMIFPGQGSQSIGMLSTLADLHPEIKETFQEASDALNLDLWTLANEGPEANLNQTENTQPLMLTGGIAVYRVWRKASSCIPQMMAGHSLGEYTALVAANALRFKDAVNLVAARGRFMQAAVPEGTGAMAAILGLNDQQVEAVCAEATANGGIAEAVNFNSPGQVVIAGEASAIAKAAELAKEAGAKRAILLPVSVPSHCKLMRGAADQLGEALSAISIEMPEIPVVHNVDVSVSTSPEEIKDKLKAQLYRPVHWSETIVNLRSNGIEALVECGPGKVLTGLNRKIDKDIIALPISDPNGLEKALEELAC